MSGGWRSKNTEKSKGKSRVDDAVPIVKWGKARQRAHPIWLTVEGAGGWNTETGSGKERGRTTPCGGGGYDP